MSKLERIVLASLLASLFLLVGARHLLEKSREVHITVRPDAGHDIIVADEVQPPDRRPRP